MGVSATGDPVAMWEQQLEELQEISSTQDTFCQSQHVSLRREHYSFVMSERVSIHPLTTASTVTIAEFSGSKSIC